VDESEQVDLRQFPRRVIDWRLRVALGAIGVASWAAGGAASFVGGNGGGAAALIAVGAGSSVLGLIGRWPSRIAMSGNELTWDDVRETVDSQIEVAEASGQAQNVLAELSSLRDRLDTLQRTGNVPTHPAELYDQAVEAAIRRLIPEAEIVRQHSRSRDQADFAVWWRGQRLYVETKWRSDPLRVFRGSTLPQLLANLPDGAKLLVVVNTVPPPSPDAVELVASVIGDRGRIVGWRDVVDDGKLGRALIAVFDFDRRRGD
jgi:hypothetical protein